jgi:hypothetical protein
MMIVSRFIMVGLFPPYCTSEIAVGTSYVSYFAQFYVWFVSEPEFDKAGDKLIAHLSFQETEKFPA